MSVPSADLADALSTILRAIDTPEGKAAVLSLVQAVATDIEGKTTNPFVKGLEVWAFKAVEGYLSPATPVVPVTPAPSALHEQSPWPGCLSDRLPIERYRRG